MEEALELVRKASCNVDDMEVDKIFIKDLEEELRDIRISIETFRSKLQNRLNTYGF